MTKKPPPSQEPAPFEEPLAGTMADIVSHIGKEAAYRFVLEFGGQRMWMGGKGVSADIEIYVGPKHTKSLVCAYKGDYLDVPIANQRIARWLALQGWAPRTIARRLRVKEASVRGWLNDNPPRNFTRRGVTPQT